MGNEQTSLMEMQKKIPLSGKKKIYIPNTNSFVVCFIKTFSSVQNVIINMYMFCVYYIEEISVANYDSK